MSILSDVDITDLCWPTNKELIEQFLQTQNPILPPTVFQPMIEPFFDHQIKTRRNPNGEGEQRILSYGLSSAGYDVRLGTHFKIFKNTKCQLIDPLNMDDSYYDDHEGDFCIIPGNGYILGLTMETFHIPRNVVVLAVGKSTLARCGAIVNVTPIEPGWNGKIVIEIANASNVPIKIYSGMGIAQFIFNKLSSPCLTSYEDRAGKYQNQNSLVTAKV